jgi:hypothetical protein
VDQWFSCYWSYADALVGFSDLVFPDAVDGRAGTGVLKRPAVGAAGRFVIMWQVIAAAVEEQLRLRSSAVYRRLLTCASWIPLWQSKRYFAASPNPLC